MHSMISYNGTMVAAAEVSISPVNAGLLHGVGVFTTLRVYNGQPFLFEEHFQRLSQNARTIGLPDCWAQGVVRDALISLIHANNFLEGKVRITLMQNESRYWRLSSASTAPFEVSLLIFTAPLQNRPSEVALTISPYRLNSNSPIAGVKVIDNLQQILTLKEAEKRQFDEAVILNERGEICEAAAANLFWVRGGVLYTPTLATGCLPGITRNYVLNLAHQLHIETTEGAFHIEHLMTADEAFLTSSTRELTQANSINIHQFPSRAHSVFERLLTAYKNSVYKITHAPKLRF